MRLHRFFIAGPLEGKKQVSLLDTELIHQWKNVFRLKAGDTVLLLDNSGLEYLSEITFLSKEKAEVKILESRPVENVPQKEIWLYAALIKKDHFEWILEKGTEIGVSHFVPVISERSEKKNLNLDRAEKIIKEAAEQSGRGTLPTVDEVTPLPQAIKECNISAVALHPSQKNTFKEEKIFKTENRIALFVGPEGGWTDDEIALFKDHNIQTCSLGWKILRAETAAIIAPSLLLL